MRIPRLLQSVSLIVIVLGTSFTALLAQDTGQTIIKREAINRDFYGAGETVHLMGPVRGDATLFGQQLTVDGLVSGDIMAAGELITINGNVQDDIRAAGRLIRLNSRVTDHMVAAGETITLSPTANIAGWAWLAGRKIEVFGQVGKLLQAVGEEVIIAGQINGPVGIVAERVKVLDGAVINGDLTVQSPRPPEVASGARISGEVKHQLKPEVDHAPLIKLILFVGLVGSAGIILAGLVYYLLFPTFTVTSGRHIETVPLACLGLGFVVLLLTPVLIGVLFMLGVGYLIALMLLAAYLLIVISGGMTGVIYLSDVTLRRLFNKAQASKGLMLASLLGAFILLGLVQLIPLLGSLVVFVLTVMGIGALKYQFWQQYKVA